MYLVLFTIIGEAHLRNTSFNIITVYISTSFYSQATLIVDLDLNVKQIDTITYTVSFIFSIINMISY